MIERIIFNELASHRAVELPGVGVLRIVRRSAHVEEGAMVPPRNMVVFSVKGADDTPSVIDLGADEAVYDKWLSGAMVGGELVIGGVGRLQMGEFIPAVELERMLNPGVVEPAVGAASQPVAVAAVSEPAADDDVPDLAAASSTFSEPVPALAATAAATDENSTLHTPNSKLLNDMDNRTNYDTSAGGYGDATPRRRCAAGVLTALIVFLLLAMAAAFVFYIMPMRREVAQLRNESQNLQEQLRTQAAAPVVTPEPEAVATPAPEVEKYHLIVGSFTHPEQAQKLADRYRKNYPNLTIKVFDNGSGRTYVSVFQNESRGKAYSQFYKVADQTGDWDNMWVWERP